MKEWMREPIAIDVCARDGSTTFDHVPNRGRQNSHSVWRKFLCRCRPAAFSLLLAIGSAASPASAFGADGGSYRNAIKDVLKVYQAVTSSPYNEIRKELETTYGRFEKGMDGVIAAMNGQPLPAFGDGTFDEDLAGLEKKVDGFTMPDLQPIPAFPIGILGLSRDALRQEIRAGVGFVFAARSSGASGSGYIDELQADQDSVNSFAEAIRKYGESLDPLLELGYLPVTQRIAFNVLDLRVRYPGSLSGIADKIGVKKEKAKDLLAKYNHDAQRTIDYLLAALDAEDQLLQHDREELVARSKEEDRLAALVVEKSYLHFQAAETSRKSDEELQNANHEANTLNQKVIQSEAEVRRRSSDVDWKLQLAHNAYSLCPNHHNWDNCCTTLPCDHAYLKTQWMTSSAPQPLAYRQAQQDLDQARSQLLRMRQYRDDLRKRLSDLENKAAAAERQKEYAKQVWLAASDAKNKYSARFNVWKMETKIALYSSENEKDRRDLANLRTEFN